MAPARSHKPDTQVLIVPGVGKMQGSYASAFSCLPRPADSVKLVLLVGFDEVKHIPVGLQLVVLLEELHQIMRDFIDRVNLLNTVDIHAVLQRTPCLSVIM